MFAFIWFLLIASSLAHARSLQTTCPVILSTFCASKTGLFANPCDSTCNSFLSCANNQGWLQTCPPGLVFNPSQK